MAYFRPIASSSMATRSEADGSLNITSNRKGLTSIMVTPFLGFIFIASSSLSKNSAQTLDSFTKVRENFFFDDSAQTAKSKEVTFRKDSLYPDF